jgi:hypothetical protein
MALQIKITAKGLSKKLDKIQGDFERYVRDAATMAEDVVKSNTPIRSGNAQRNWKKSVSDKDFTLSNRVPYIEKLDKGSSRQAPNGIKQPSINQIKRNLKK